MYYNISNAFHLIENPSEYDLIIRARPDLFLNDDIANKILTADLKKLTIFNRHADHVHNQPSDILFLGPPDIMKHVCNLYSHIETLNRKLGFFCCHLSLKEHIESKYGKDYIKHVVPNEIISKYAKRNEKNEPIDFLPNFKKEELHNVSKS